MKHNSTTTTTKPTNYIHNPGVKVFMKQVTGRNGKGGSTHRDHINRVAQAMLNHFVSRHLSDYF